jgi:hypothetical protein
MLADMETIITANGIANGINGHSNTTPAHPAFDSIQDCLQAFGVHSPLSITYVFSLNVRIL